MPDKEDKIYESPPSEPDDDFWLEQGRKMLEESVGAVRDAAKSLMTGVGLLKAIYLGILGFADFVPETMPLSGKLLFITPLLFWVLCLYFSMQVLMTRHHDVVLRSPEEVRRIHGTTLRQKQAFLRTAFWMLTVGLLAALFLLVFRSDI